MFDVVDKKLWLTSLALIAIIAFIISLAIKSGTSDLNISTVSWYLASISTSITAATLWHLALTKWVWRWKRLRLWYVKCPDMSGRYKATLNSITFGREHIEDVTIDQDLEELRYTSENDSPSSGSINKSLSSRIHIEGRRCICYIVYENKNSRDPSAGVDHEGVIILLFLLDNSKISPNTISGKYFTNKPRSKSDLNDRGTHGDIILRKIRDDVH